MKDIIEKLENTPAEEYDLEKEETISHIKNLIYELPEQRRKILELAAFYGKTYQEIAEMLDISVNTVNTQMSRAYRFLRDNLSKDELLLLFFFRKYKII
jgi:RNA polymerase sigma-70 factor (ECF subfamily)